jgi:hypothetical protein
VRLQHGANVVDHLLDTAIDLVTQQHGAAPLVECRVVGDRTRRAHAVEDIICYS